MSRRLLGIVLLSLLLSAGVYFLVHMKPETPSRPHLVLAESLMPALRDAEFVRTTVRVNLGSDRGRRHTVEADPTSGAEARGVLSRPDEETPFVWVVGRRLELSVDVVEVVDRQLTLVLAAATDAPQRVEIVWNGELLGEADLRTDNRSMPVGMRVPAADQRLGRNPLELRFAETQDRLVEGEAVALPVSAQLFLLRFEQFDEVGAPMPVLAEPPQARLASMTDGESADEAVATRLEQPAGTSVVVAASLPDTARVALRIDLDLLERPLVWSLLSETGERHELIALDPRGDGPGSLNVDLGAWSGQTVRLESRVPGPGPGEVHQRGLVLLAPQDEVEALAPPPEWKLEVASGPVFQWNHGGHRLIVDPQRRLVRLYERGETSDVADVSPTRQATTALLLQQLVRQLLDAEGEQAAWAEPLRALQRRQ